MKYLPLFHHFKAIYQFPKHIIFLVKIVANAPLIKYGYTNFILTFVVWISESLKLDISGQEGRFTLAAAALDNGLERALASLSVSLSCSGIKGSCEMFAAVEQDGLLDTIT